jgi:hypothetical protein
MAKAKSSAEKPARKTTVRNVAERTARSAGGPPKSRPSTATEADASVSLSANELHRLIEEAAYFKAKARNFAPGHEVQDWIEAESEVRLRFDSAPQRQGRQA